jgi:hypothetical protein
MKKLLVVAVLMIGFGLGFINSSMAAATPPWYECAVVAVGANGGGIYNVTLTNPAFPTGSQGANTTVFLLDNNGGNANSMLATALTAFANSTMVLVNTTGTTDLSLITTVQAYK